MQRTGPHRKETGSSLQSAAAKTWGEFGDNKKIPALDSLFETFGDGAVAINADNTELNVFAAAQVQQGVEQSLLGLVAERREMVQNNQQRNAANLGFLQNLEVNHNICLHDLKKLHVFELSVFESLI